MIDPTRPLPILRQAELLDVSRSAVYYQTRRVLAWRVAISLAVDGAVEALKEALARYGTPEITNTDHGSQFTASDFIDLLQEHDIRISLTQAAIAGKIAQLARPAVPIGRAKSWRESACRAGRTSRPNDLVVSASSQQQSLSWRFLFLTRQYCGTWKIGVRPGDSYGHRLAGIDGRFSSEVCIRSSEIACADNDLVGLVLDVQQFRVVRRDHQDAHIEPVKILLQLQLAGVCESGHRSAREHQQGFEYVFHASSPKH
jgi:integrase-like protein